MLFHLTITDKTIEKLKDKISPDTVKKLELRKNFLFREAQLKSTLMFLGICSEEIKVIINTCEASVVDNPKEEPIYIVPKKETIVGPTKLPVCIESKKETNIIVPKKDPVCKSSKKAPIHKAPENTNKLYLKITSKTIEKLKEQIGSDVIRYLEIRVLSSNTSNIKSLKKKLKAHGADEEEINLIINNCEVVKPVLPVKKSKLKMITRRDNPDSKEVIAYQNNSKTDTQKINYLIKKGNIMSDKLCNYKEAIQCYNQAFTINKNKEVDKKLIYLIKKCEDKIEKQKLLKKSNELKKNSSPIFLNKAIKSGLNKDNERKKTKEGLETNIYQFSNSIITDVYKFFPTANYKDDT